MWKVGQRVDVRLQILDEGGTGVESGSATTRHTRINQTTGAAEYLQGDLTSFASTPVDHASPVIAGRGFGQTPVLVPSSADGYEILSVVTHVDADGTVSKYQEANRVTTRDTDDVYDNDQLEHDATQAAIAGIPGGGGSDAGAFVDVNP